MSKSITNALSLSLILLGLGLSACGQKGPLIVESPALEQDEILQESVEGDVLIEDDVIEEKLQNAPQASE